MNTESHSDLTLYKLLKDVPMPIRGQRGRRRTGTTSIVNGLEPVPFKNEVGYRIIEPAELLSLRIPVVGKADTAIEGYQRTTKILHATTIAWALKDGKELPPINISLDELGHAYCTDGQHRSIGAIIARKPIDAVIKQRSYERARQMFVDQKFQKSIDRSHQVLVGTDKMSLYVQDALTRDDHPWSHMVHESNTRKLSPSAMHRLVTMYGCDVIGRTTAEYIDKMQERFSEKRADELSELIGAFGTSPEGTFTRDNNPLAFHQTNLSALAQTAVHIFIRADEVHPGEDKDRWMRHMVQFNWVAFHHLKRENEIVDALLQHWNKRKSARRVERVVYESTHTPLG